MCGIPCFTYASDYKDYSIYECGTYYEMDELPFPYADTNEKLVKNILCYDESEHQKKWLMFSEEEGLYESGHSAEEIADYMVSFLRTGKKRRIKEEKKGNDNEKNISGNTGKSRF